MSTKGEIKLIDFGLCLNIEKDGEKNHLVGSPFWMSPEMVARQPHSYLTDIWSFAISLLELANHHAPNKDSWLRAMFLVGTEGLPHPLEQPQHWGNDFKDFLSRCLQKNPKDRPSATQLLAHPFIERAASQSIMEAFLSQIFVNHLLENAGI